MRNRIHRVSGAAAALLISPVALPAAGADAAGPEDGKVERVSSLTVTEVPRSELRDVNVDVSDAERAEELRADLDVEHARCRRNDRF